LAGGAALVSSIAPGLLRAKALRRRREVAIHHPLPYKNMPRWFARHV
jgi:hypothetical protein